MSTRRTQRGGWATKKDLVKGPNGRNQCRRCSTEVPKGRRTFCGDECVHQWKLRTNPGYLRQCCYERDHGICALCGVDTLQGTRHKWRRTGHRWHADHILPVVEGGGECDLVNLRTLCVPCHKIETKKLAHRRAEQRKRGGDMKHIAMPVGTMFIIAGDSPCGSGAKDSICRKVSTLGFSVVGEEIYGEIQFTEDIDNRIVPVPGEPKSVPVKKPAKRAAKKKAGQK